MKVGLDVLSLSSPQGGIRRYTEELLRGFSRVADDTEFVLLGDPTAAIDSELDERFRWVSRKSISVRHLVDQFQILGLEGDLDVFHGTNYWTPLRSRCPTVLTVHDLTVQLLPKTHPAIRRLRHRMLPRLCRNARRVIADSLTTREDLVRLYDLPVIKVDVVELAVSPRFNNAPDPDCVREVSRRYSLPDSFLLFVGTLNPRKNLSHLIEAAAILKGDGFESPLVIVGEGAPSEVARVQQAAQRLGLEIGRDVRLVGGVPDSDLLAFYALCDVFVFPSRYEGFGLPPIEAMACGAPVVLSNRSSLGEIYRDAAICVDTGHVAEFARAIAGVLVDGGRGSQKFTAPLAEGRKRLLQRTWDDVARETLEVYGRAVSAG